MADKLGSLDSLSVESIAAEKGGSEEGRLRQQAANNVARQSFASAMRGVPTGGKAPSGKKAAGPSEQAEPKPEDGAKAAKELADLIAKVQGFMSNPTLGPKLAGIAVPRNGTKLEYQTCLEQIRNKLGEGLGPDALRYGYFAAVRTAIPHLPGPLALPRNADRHLGSVMFNPDPTFRSEDIELALAELAIEYSSFFRSGPIARLVFGTVRVLHEYKSLVDAGLIDPDTGGPTLDMTAFSGIPTPSSSAPAAVPAPEPSIQLPPPMKLYPDERPTSGSISPSSSSSAPIGHPQSSISSHDSIFDIPAPAPSPVSVSRGKGKGRGK